MRVACQQKGMIVEQEESIQAQLYAYRLRRFRRGVIKYLLAARCPLLWEPPHPSSVSTVDADYASQIVHCCMVASILTKFHTIMEQQTQRLEHGRGNTQVKLYIIRVRDHRQRQCSWIHLKSQSSDSSSIYPFWVATNNGWMIRRNPHPPSSAMQRTTKLK